MEDLINSKAPKAQKKPYWHNIKLSRRLLRPQEVASLLGLSRSQIYQMIADGELPPFIKLSSRASAMPEVWLDAFIKQRVSKATGNEGGVR